MILYTVRVELVAWNTEYNSATGRYDLTNEISIDKSVESGTFESETMAEAVFEDAADGARGCTDADD